MKWIKKKQKKKMNRSTTEENGRDGEGVVRLSGREWGGVSERG